MNLYRNRLGLIHHTKILKRETDFFVYDEIFWNLRKDNFFRNRLILGCSIKATKWITPQIWYTYQSEKGVQPQHQFYLIGRFLLKTMVFSRSIETKIKTFSNCD